MHILLLAEDFYPNVSGGAFARWRFCQLAVDKGHQVTVFTPREDETPYHEIVDGVEIVRPFPAKPHRCTTHSPISIVTRVLFAIPLFLYLVWWLRGRKIDGVHSASHSLHCVGKVISILEGAPFVNFIGYTPSQKGEWAWTPEFIREWLNFRFCMGGVVFCRVPKVQEIILQHTNACVEVLHGILHKETIREIGNKTDPTSVHKQLGVDETQKLIVTVGRLVPIKNPTGAVQVIDSLPDGFHLILVGDGPERQRVEQTVKDQGCADNVTLAGEAPHEVALQTIAAADALLLPSRSEAYPTVVFEALALATPVFARPVGVIPEITHPQLRIGSLEEIPELIQQTDLAGTGRLNTETLTQYSMEHYTQGILKAFKELSANS